MPVRSDPGMYLPLLLVLLPALAGAAAPAWPDAQAVEQARRDRPFPTPQQLDQAPLPGPPRIETARPALDITALARRHAPATAASALREQPALRIFVTLAMPEPSLQLLVEQARRSGATLLLRGLKDHSMKQTLAVVQALIGDRRVAWQIDPEAYARYGVVHAPTFVLSLPASQQETACAGHCATGTGHFSVSGDVSLEYALETLMRRHPEAGAPGAAFLQRLRTNP